MKAGDFAFPETTSSISGGAWIVSRTRRLPDGRFEAVAALFAANPATGSRTGLRCNQLFAVAHSRKSAESRAVRALEKSSVRAASMAAGFVAMTSFGLMA